MQEDRLAQYGLLSKGGGGLAPANTRHGNVPVDTDSKGRIDLGTVQVNAANLGERKAPMISMNESTSAQQANMASASRNPYQDSTTIQPKTHLSVPSPTKQVAFQTLGTPQQLLGGGKMVNNSQWRHQSQRDLSMPADARLDAF